MAFKVHFPAIASVADMVSVKFDMMIRHYCWIEQDATCWP